MARLPYVTDESASPQVRAIYTALRGGRTEGFLPNSFRLLAHSPPALRWFWPFWAAIHPEGGGASGDIRYRELAIIRTSQINRCRY
ncbi:MAG: hypothetical protein HY330_05840 [Chloroflexi bacterium]|nr:hypothetical protein [Chloroflexota bacterium]